MNMIIYTTKNSLTVYLLHVTQMIICIVNFVGIDLVSFLTIYTRDMLQRTVNIGCVHNATTCSAKPFIGVLSKTPNTKKHPLNDVTEDS